METSLDPKKATKFFAKHRKYQLKQKSAVHFAVRSTARGIRSIKPTQEVKSTRYPNKFIIRSSSTEKMTEYSTPTEDRSAQPRQFALSARYPLRAHQIKFVSFPYFMILYFPIPSFCRIPAEISDRNRITYIPTFRYPAAADTHFRFPLR